MRRRHIALTPGPDSWAFAVATGDGGETVLHRTGCFARDPQQPLAEQLADLIGPRQLSDRLACALPGKDALVRWLNFPFTEARKIAAALPPELGRQLPEPLHKRAVFHLAAPTAEQPTLALAVDRDKLETLLAQFDDQREPLGYVGLAPFCHVAALDWPSDSLFLHKEASEIALCRVENSRVVALRILPNAETANDELIVREACLLARCHRQQLTRISLLGVAADHSLPASLSGAGFECDRVRLDSSEGPVADELLATATLALSAAKAKATSLNLRSGEYKLKSEWQTVKRRAWFAAALLLLSGAMLGGSGYLQVATRQAEIAQLRQQATSLYQRQFPGEKLVAPAPLQLQSKLRELRKKSSQFGSTAPGALTVLNAISRNIPAEIPINIREYLHGDDGVRLSGNTSSFEAVSQLLARLQKEPLFKEVRILDSKQALDGSRVDFQLQVQLQQGGER